MFLNVYVCPIVNATPFAEQSCRFRGEVSGRCFGGYSANNGFSDSFEAYATGLNEIQFQHADREREPSAVGMRQN